MIKSFITRRREISTFIECPSIPCYPMNLIICEMWVGKPEFEQGLEHQTFAWLYPCLIKQPNQKFLLMFQAKRCVVSKEMLKSFILFYVSTDHWKILMKWIFASTTLSEIHQEKIVWQHWTFVSMFLFVCQHLLKLISVSTKWLAAQSLQPFVAGQKQQMPPGSSFAPTLFTYTVF